MKVPGLYREESTTQPRDDSSSQQHTQLSTKKTWRLKKYTKTDDEIKEEQKLYEDLEFSPKKTSSRRPRNKPGQTKQEFVFVDLSPRKKEVKHPKEETNTKSLKKQGRVSRLFRLSSSQENIKEPLPCSELNIEGQGSSYIKSVPVSKTQSASTIHQQLPARPPALKRSYTTLANQRHEQRERSNSSASLVMTISDSGRAVLQPCSSSMAPISQQPLSASASSSTSDLFSLTRNSSTRQTYYSRSPIPSPKRMESPIPQDRFPTTQPAFDFIPKYNLDPTSSEDEDEHSDALKAFSKAVKRSSNNGRKRTNTISSQTSNQSGLVSPAITKTLSRNLSISSLPSIYTKTARLSPSRANLLRLATTPTQTPDFVFGDGSTASNSYFDDTVKVHKPRAFQHTKQMSISVLGPPLQIGGEEGEDNGGETDGSESTFDFLHGEEQMSFSHAIHDAESAPSTAFSVGDEFQKLDSDDLFDFNAFVNFGSAREF